MWKHSDILFDLLFPFLKNVLRGRETFPLTSFLLWTHASVLLPTSCVT